MKTPRLLRLVEITAPPAPRNSSPSAVRDDEGPPVSIHISPSEIDPFGQAHTEITQPATVGFACPTVCTRRSMFGRFESAEIVSGFVQRSLEDHGGLSGRV